MFETTLVESADVITSFKMMLVRLRLKSRHALCSAIHGGHELYRARTDTKLYQECLLCGYETPGWTIDRRDRRLHLVSPDAKVPQIVRDAFNQDGLSRARS